MLRCPLVIWPRSGPSPRFPAAQQNHPAKQHQAARYLLAAISISRTIIMACFHLSRNCRPYTPLDEPIMRNDPDTDYYCDYYCDNIALAVCRQTRRRVGGRRRQLHEFMAHCRSIAESITPTSSARSRWWGPDAVRAETCSRKSSGAGIYDPRTTLLQSAGAEGGAVAARLQCTRNLRADRMYER